MEVQKQKFSIRWPYFFGALLIGVLYVISAEPPKKERLTFPTPFNAEKITYKDKGGNCFVISATEVPCPEDGKGVKKQRIQEDFNAVTPKITPKC